MKNLRIILLISSGLFMSIKLQAQPCVKEISTNPDNPVNAPFAVEYPNLINPWLNTFDIFAGQIACGSANAQNLTFKSSNTGNTPLTISPDGKVGINTDFFVNNHSLYIEGSSVAEEMYVKLKADWPDYVFTDQYDLMPLNELGDFIEKNGYLPKMPSADTVKEEGLATGETIRLLTEKVEELTLYLLQQQSEIEELKAKIKD